MIIRIAFVAFQIVFHTNVHCNRAMDTNIEKFSYATTLIQIGVASTFYILCVFLQLDCSGV